MMSVIEYAQDINQTVESVLKKCQELNIKVIDGDSELTEEDIITLDGTFNIVETDKEIIEEIEEDEILEERVEKLIQEEEFEEYAKPKASKAKKKNAVDIAKDNKEEFTSKKKEIYRHKEKLYSNVPLSEDANIINFKEEMTVAELASILEVDGKEIVKKLIGLGIMTSVNNSLDYEQAELIALDYNKILKRDEENQSYNFENFDIVDNEKYLQKRPSVVTIMGHVDHGKTSLLDAIRSTDVASGEAGGITQNISSYQVEYKGEKITFVDTPGHAAFTAMRARGASFTDIVIIIVAADDGVMPQTKEAIDHAKAAKVPIIVAINKMDVPNANPDKVLAGIGEYGLTPEEWGGDTIVSKISAKTKEGIDELLENILLISEMEDLKANPTRYALGTVIESRLDKQVGSIVTLLIQNGTLRIGDPIVVGDAFGKVRTMKNDKDQDIIEALPSTPVEITGLNETPQAGDKFMAFETEKQARLIGEQRKKQSHLQANSGTAAMSLEELFTKIQEGVKEFNVIIKADVTGSAEALKTSIEKINVKDIKVNVVRSSVGTITESDVALAQVSNAIIIGFNIRPSAKTKEVAATNGVDIRLHTIIYKVVEELEAAMKGMLDPEFEEKVLGQAEIRKLFKFSKVGIIAGCYILDGIIKRDAKSRIIRDGVIINESKIDSIQREKNQAKDVKAGLECGITIENYNDLKEGDIIEAFEMVEVKK